jgi:hypothetical protein
LFISASITLSQAVEIVGMVFEFIASTYYYDKFTNIDPLIAYPSIILGFKLINTLLIKSSTYILNYGLNYSYSILLISLSFLSSATGLNSTAQSLYPK